MKVAHLQLTGSVFLAAVVGLAASQSAWAAPTGTAEVSYTGVINDNDDTSGHITDGSIRVWGDSLPNGIRGKGGIYIIDLGATTGEGDDIITQPNGDLYVFCIELPQLSSNATNVYDVRPLDEAPDPNYAPIGGMLGTTKADYIRELWAAYFAAAVADNTGLTAEAFSLAVWEIVYEDDDSLWDVTTWLNIPNSFKAEDFDGNGSEAIANAMLASLTGAPDAPKANLRGLTHPDFQDYIVEVPEPASLALMGVGAAVMLYRRRHA